MPSYQEHGLTALLADDNYFRFCECPIYKKLSASFLREMDFGWWDNNSNYLYLMEFTDYSSLTIDQQLPEGFLDEIISKILDCLLMLSSIWSRSQKGHQLQTEINTTCPLVSNTLCNIKIIFVIKIESRQSRELIAPLLTRLRERLKSKVSLFDIDVKNDIQLLTHEVAKRLKLPVDY